MVLAHNESPRINWRLAIIKDLINGGDNSVRAAVICTSAGKLTSLLQSCILWKYVRASVLSTDILRKAMRHQLHLLEVVASHTESQQGKQPSVQQSGYKPYRPPGGCQNLHRSSNL